MKGQFYSYFVIITFWNSFCVSSQNMTEYLQIYKFFRAMLELFSNWTLSIFSESNKLFFKTDNFNAILS